MSRSGATADTDTQEAAAVAAAAAGFMGTFEWASQVGTLLPEQVCFLWLLLCCERHTCVGVVAGVSTFDAVGGIILPAANDYSVRVWSGINGQHMRPQKQA